MNYLNNDQLQGAECSQDAVKSSELLLGKMEENSAILATLSENEPRQRAGLLIENGYILLDLSRSDEAWEKAHQAFTLALAEEVWEDVVRACDIIYTAEKDDAIKAMVHGIWLGVAYPIDPELSVAMLQHLVEETPDSSDGGAVAAAVANYIVDLRADGPERDDLKFFASQLLGQVARRHSKVEEQEIFDFWIERMELNDPQKFLPRLAQVLDVLVEPADWWFDRDTLRERIPVEG